jgi:hypothetical protein
MPPKTKSSGYVFILYNGCIKVGFARTGYLEDGEIETHLETFKEHYGNKVKGRYVKSTTPKEHFEALNEKFTEFSEGECVYKVNTTNLVNGLRDVSGVKIVKTWNVYPGSEEEEADGDASGKETEQEQKTTKGKTSTKEVEVDEENEDQEPTKPVTKKVASKAKTTDEEPPKAAPKKVQPKAKAVKEEVAEEEEEEAEEKPAPKVTKKAVAKK